MQYLELGLFSILAAAAFMSLAWIFAAKWNFYSLVDVAWAYGIGLLCLTYAISGTGNTLRILFFSIAILFWSIRLGTHLALRLQKKFPEEDKRYQKIRVSWKDKSARNFFWFFQFQALSQPLLSIPFLLASNNSNPISTLDYCALFIAIIGVLGETTADNQLKEFKLNPNNLNKVCDVGLWKYSRHPNYFFEWIIWCGFSLFGISSPYGLISLLSPIVMFLLLNYVTGVPPAEEQSLQSKGDLYRNYQKRTQRFFPWIPSEK